jgi:F0F1-type ATP synthase gamma subunit
MNKLNIYIANDYGFCGNFNSQIGRQIKKDIDDYKIIIGSKIVYKDDKTILKMDKDNFYNEFDKIEDTIDSAIRNSTYSEINLYYNHYNSSTSFEFRKLTLFPIEFDGEYDTKNDFVIETDITSMLHSLLTFYILYELRMCECISRAAENVLRNQITTEAIDKIEEIEMERKNEKRREMKSKLVKKTVENFKKVSSREEENG